MKIQLIHTNKNALNWINFALNRRNNVITLQNLVDISKELGLKLEVETVKGETIYTFKE